MKMVMRVQKAQVPSQYKWTAGAGSWNKILAELAGYTKFDVTMIGAAAGTAGSAAGSDATKNMVYGSGGGGGGMLFLNERLLKDLAADTNFVVGSAGRHGADSKNTIKAENGISGGNSSFGAWAAYGGSPSVGGRVDQVGGGVGWVEGKGGDGGGNSLNIQDAGHMGLGGEQIGNNFPTQPTEGWIAAGPSLGDLGGRGGGGGMGRTKIDGATEWSNQNGAQGNDGFSAFSSPGGPAASSLGGCGGGADLRAVTGSGTDPHDYYGSYAPGSNPNGVVLLQLS